ncbi:MAG: hypothetical protein J3K34DRAFT_411064, partial [Monoraphidium minutum]
MGPADKEPILLGPGHQEPILLGPGHQAPILLPPPPRAAPANASARAAGSALTLWRMLSPFRAPAPAAGAPPPATSKAVVPAAPPPMLGAAGLFDERLRPFHPKPCLIWHQKPVTWWELATAAISRPTSLPPHPPPVLGGLHLSLYVCVVAASWLIVAALALAVAAPPAHAARFARCARRRRLPR